MNITHFEVVVTSTCAAVSASGAAIALLWKYGRKANHVLDEILGQEAALGNDRKPGWGERLTSIEELQQRQDSGQLYMINQLRGLEYRIYNVEVQVHPDHGNSIYDRITRIEGKIDQTKNDLDNGGTK